MMCDMKTATTTITRSQLAEAEGGYLPTGDTTLVTVECPTDYDPALITADDIIHDGAITTVDQ